ncbi:MAG: pyruvate formate lyase family protein [Sinimarinibacterium sp.]|jgi:formate C-acetyltransferase
MNVAVKLDQPRTRIERIRDAVHAAGYSLCLERPTLLLKFRKSRAGSRLRDAHVCVRRATAIAYVMAQRRPHLYDDELIVGNMSSKRVAANYYPEGASVNIVEDLTRMGRRAVPLKLSLGEKARLARIAAATFRDSVAFHALSSPARIRHLWEILHAKRYIVTEQAGIAHQVGNYARVIRSGLVASDELAARCLECGQTPDGAALDADQRAFYESIRIIVAGIRRMTANLADEAERLAQAPDCPAARRVELAAAAAALRHVPYFPARNFREGLQAAWIVHVSLCLEDYEQGLSFGRLDQALIELYDQDLANGTLTRAGAVELVASFQLKCCETMPVYSTRMDHYFSGHDVAQGITLGGVDAQGRDVTNELSGIFLDAYSLLGTREPSLHVRIHQDTPAWFLAKSVATLQTTGARPAFYGDEAVIRAMRSAGYSEAHARDYAVIGCTELASQGRTANSADAALFNLPLCLELALNAGRTFAGKRLGADTAPAESMQSMDDVLTSYREQVRYAVDEMAQVMGWLEQAVRQHRTTPVNSLITDGCLERGRDITWGGAEYNFTSVQAVGLADVGDSLYALNRMVFEERRMQPAEFVAILRADFAGHETLRLELQRRFKRFGNGEAEVDRWVTTAADTYIDVVSRHRSSRGGQWIAGFYSMTCGHAFGRYTGALPNGHRAGTRLSNGCSPVDGADRSGPSALFRSVASLDRSRWSNSHVLNATFDKKTIGGKTGAAVLASLLRTYFLDQQGLQVQIAVLDAAALKLARENPQAFPNLLVRVSGYCAYFADLQPEIQDEIIARTMHG